MSQPRHVASQFLSVAVSVLLTDPTPMLLTSLEKIECRAYWRQISKQSSPADPHSCIHRLGLDVHVKSKVVSDWESSEIMLHVYQLATEELGGPQFL